MPHYRLDLYSLNAAGATVVHSFATTGYITSALGSPPFYVDGRLKQPGLLRRHLYGRGRLIGSGEPSISTGSFTLDNTDGELDSLQDYSFDGQTYSLTEFDPETGEDATYSPVRSGVIEQPIYTSESEVVIAVRDAIYGLDAPLLVNRYAGNNSLPAGVEGTTDIEGQPKPLCLGIVYNISPVCVNTSKLIYQVDGQNGLTSGYTISVYDKRVAITADGAGEYSSQADMEANAPAAGTYRVWRAGGMFRLNAIPALLTCDVNNPPLTFDSLLGAAFFGGSTPIVKADSFSVIHFTGIYLREDCTKLEALTQLLRNISAFYTAGPTCDSNAGTNVLGAWLGQNWIGQLVSLTDHASIYSSAPDPIPLSSILSIRQERPTDALRGLPVWRVNVRYRKNYTIMSKADLAAASASDQERFSKPYLTSTAEDASVLTQWPNATELNIDTLIDVRATARDEAIRLLGLFSTPRRLFAVKVAAAEIRDNMPSPGVKEQFSLLHPVTLTYPRFGLDAGVTLLVVGIEEDLEEDTYDLLLCEVP